MTIPLIEIKLGARLMVSYPRFKMYGTVHSRTIDGQLVVREEDTGILTIIGENQYIQLLDKHVQLVDEGDQS